jgi:hypothetical protein
MKSISDELLVAANNAGALQLTVETSVVSVKTYFKDLENPSWDEKDEAANGTNPQTISDPEQFVEYAAN